MVRRRLVAIVSIALLLFALPTASASASQEDCGNGPPCGWIAPLLDMILEDKPTCGSGFLLTEINPDDCLAPPQEGTPIVLTGQFRLYWELCEEATYLNDATDPIVVSFSSTNRNPSFIEYSVEPNEFVLDTTTLFDPNYIIPDQRADGSQTCWYDYRQPITVTFTRSGEPTAADLEQIKRHEGIAQFHIKMQSDESGENFKSGWGIEPFRFHMDHEEGFGSNNTPGVAPLGVLAALGAAFVARRR